MDPQTQTGKYLSLSPSLESMPPRMHYTTDHSCCSHRRPAWDVEYGLVVLTVESEPLCSVISELAHSYSVNFTLTSGVSSPISVLPDRFGIVAMRTMMMVVKHVQLVVLGYQAIRTPAEFHRLTSSLTLPSAADTMRNSARISCFLHCILLSIYSDLWHFRKDNIRPLHSNFVCATLLSLPLCQPPQISHLDSIIPFRLNLILLNLLSFNSFALQCNLNSSLCQSPFNRRQTSFWERLEILPPPIASLQMTTGTGPMPEPSTLQWGLTLKIDLQFSYAVRRYENILADLGRNSMLHGPSGIRRSGGRWSALLRGSSPPDVAGRKKPLPA
jgi:hypothetical protein